jgi:hypothetical protein
MVVVKRGRTIALLAAALTSAILLALGVVARDRIAEPWWLWQLEHGDEDAQEKAVWPLGQLRSVRAVPLLLSRILATSTTGIRGHVLSSGGVSLSGGDIEAVRALAHVGGPAVPDLLRALKGQRPGFPVVAVLFEMGPAARAALPELRSIRQETNDGDLAEDLKHLIWRLEWDREMGGSPFRRKGK